MPELPEVETVRRVLKEELIDKKIKSVRLLYEPIFENSDRVNELIGNQIKDIDRKGKYLIFILEKGYLLSHLRMEGKYFYLPSTTDLNKHMHVAIDFENGYSLIYQDVRKFGRMHYYDDLDSLRLDLKLGPDANNISDTSLVELYEKLLKSRLPIKALLLDQSFIAGLGNIYVDEVLYEAKLLPNYPAKLVSFNDFKKIVEAAKEILNHAIIEKGTTIRTYTSSLGVKGNYQNFLKVHTKENCPLGHKIFKMKVGGRTSYYCPFCQNKGIKKVIGITGGIATGKSNIVANLRELGYFVSDSDSFVKEAYNDEIILNKLKIVFKEAYKDSIIDKKVIAEIIFSNETRREELNSIIHPFVIQKLKEDINKHDFLFLDIPLLYETGLESLCDKVICTSLPKNVEVERLMARDNISLEYALKKISSQMDLELKKNKADYIIDTSGSFKETNEKIIKLLEEIYDGIFL